MLLVGLIVYFVVAFASTSMFGDLIGNALSGLGVSGTC
jgi:hypothetical protein